jgi:hypothetical protein
VRYNAVHGAQLIILDDESADISFYAATNPADPYAYKADCYRITKGAAGSVTYSSCAPKLFSLLNGGLAVPAGLARGPAVDRSKLMTWK